MHLFVPVPVPVCVCVCVCACACIFTCLFVYLRIFVRAREHVIVNQADFVFLDWCTKELGIMPLPRELPSTPCLSLQGALQKYVDELLFSVRMDLLCRVHSTYTHSRSRRAYKYTHIHTCDHEGD